MTPPLPVQAHPVDECEPIEFTPEQWLRARQQALDELGMTYEELAEEARRGDFRSHRARTLWVIIGEFKW